MFQVERSPCSGPQSEGGEHIRDDQIVSKGCRSPKSVVVKAEAVLQHSKKCSNGRQFMECESEAVAFATTPVTPVNFSHNLARSPHLGLAPPYFVH